MAAENTIRSSTQLSLELPPADPYSLFYFVPHHGVSEAVALFEQAVDDLVKDPTAFRTIFIYGPSGSGKTHLVEGFALAAVSQGVSQEHLCQIDLDNQGEADTRCVDDNRWVAQFIARFEERKSCGGLVLISSRTAPGEVTDNPHLTSRFLSGSVLRVYYPSEEELRPLLLSLLERRNLKLSEKSLHYLLRRLPIDPLSFDAIFARINELSLLQGKPAGFGVVREAVHSEAFGWDK